MLGHLHDTTMFEHSDDLDSSLEVYQFQPVIEIVEQSTHSLYTAGPQ
jgi:hypothetical protein